MGLILMGGEVTQIAVRGLAETVKKGCKRRVGKHGRSAEEEMRAVLRRAARDSERP